ncbi:hypothetical protein DPMN_176360 [Dreissena polymorpha]|uniref:Uncharacterized protein n=1 Tax=Dreissena polymorpha TaxID=45954 RepID=A0A9D4II12_DREPO|nr:hypothetical protein DPMN_176360 [Dreissena polymorpha]
MRSTRYCVFHSVQQDAIKHLSWDGHQRNSLVFGAGTEVAPVGISSSSHISLKSGCITSTLAPTSALSAYAGLLSGPADLPFFNRLMSLMISSFVLVQQVIGRSLVTVGISGGFAVAGLLSSS